MFALVFAARALLVGAVLSPQEQLVSLGHKDFDTRWNDDSYKAVAAGTNYSLLIRSDDSVRVFGFDQFQLPPPGVYTKFATSEGYGTSAGILSDGTIAVWGIQTGNISNPPSLPPGTSYV